MRRAGHALLLALALGLPALAVQLSRPVPRLGADAVEYYAHLRSLYFDHDVDFANEFEHFGILERWDKQRPTVTGHRRTIFSVGPALLWMPFYAAGDVVARLRGDVADGYSSAHIRATCLGSLAYGVAGCCCCTGCSRPGCRARRRSAPSRSRSTPRSCGGTWSTSRS